MTAAAADLTSRATRYVSLVIARSSGRWEMLVEQALAEPVLLRGWEGASRSATSQARQQGEDVVDLSDCPRTLLLHHEQVRGHRLRVAQRLRRRLDDAERRTG